MLKKKKSLKCSYRIVERTLSLNLKPLSGNLKCKQADLKCKIQIVVYCSGRVAYASYTVHLSVRLSGHPIYCHISVTLPYFLQYFSQLSPSYRRTFESVTCYVYISQGSRTYLRSLLSPGHMPVLLVPFLLMGQTLITCKLYSSVWCIF